MNITSAYIQQINGVDDCIMAVIDGSQCQVPPNRRQSTL